MKLKISCLFFHVHIKVFRIFQTVVYGMLFALGLLILKRYGAITDNNKDNLFSTGISYGLMGAGVIGIGVS